MTTNLILLLIVVVNGGYAFYLLKDVIKHKQKLNTSSNPFMLAVSAMVIYFFSTFGLSDFALSTLVYRKMKWVKDKLLPGTLNTQCVLPIAVMALAYIAEVKVDIFTLVVCIMAQVVGAYIGPMIVAKLSARKIRLFIGVGLLIATIIILLDKFQIIHSSGTVTTFSNFKLFIAAIALFAFGVLNNVGIGCFPPTMLTMYALGIDPIIAFPIMMGASTFSIPIGSMQFIKLDLYDRKIALFVSIFGILGVLIAVCFVRTLNVSLLQWLMVGILFYSGVSMLYDEYVFSKKVPCGLEGKIDDDAVQAEGQ